MGKMDLNEKVSLFGAILSSAVLVIALYVTSSNEFVPMYGLIVMLSGVSAFTSWSTFFKARRMHNEKDGRK